LSVFDASLSVLWPGSRLIFVPLKVQINAHHKMNKTMEVNPTTVIYHLEASEFGWDIAPGKTVPAGL